MQKGIEGRENDDGSSWWLESDVEFDDEAETNMSFLSKFNGLNDYVDACVLAASIARNRYSAVGSVRVYQGLLVS